MSTSSRVRAGGAACAVAAACDATGVAGAPGADAAGGAWAALAIELVAPFFLLLPRRLRFWGVAAMALLQLLIVSTGNYGYFNLLALAACAALAVFRFKFGMVPVLLASSLAGVIYVLVGGPA